MKQTNLSMRLVSSLEKAPSFGANWSLEASSSSSPCMGRGIETGLPRCLLATTGTNLPADTWVGLAQWKTWLESENLPAEQVRLVGLVEDEVVGLADGLLVGRRGKRGGRHLDCCCSVDLVVGYSAGPGLSL